MKYRELLDELKAMSKEELDMEVVIYSEDLCACLEASEIVLNGGDEVDLDSYEDEHPIIYCE